MRALFQHVARDAGPQKLFQKRLVGMSCQTDNREVQAKFFAALRVATTPLMPGMERSMTTTSKPCLAGAFDRLRAVAGLARPLRDRARDR